LKKHLQKHPSIQLKNILPTTEKICCSFKIVKNGMHYGKKCVTHMIKTKKTDNLYLSYESSLKEKIKQHGPFNIN